MKTCLLQQLVGARYLLDVWPINCPMYASLARKDLKRNRASAYALEVTRAV